MAQPKEVFAAKRRTFKLPFAITPVWASPIKISVWLSWKRIIRQKYQFDQNLSFVAPFFLRIKSWWVSFHLINKKFASFLLGLEMFDYEILDASKFWNNRNWFNWLSVPIKSIKSEQALSKRFTVWDMDNFQLQTAARGDFVDQQEFEWFVCLSLLFWPHTLNGWEWLEWLLDWKGSIFLILQTMLASKKLVAFVNHACSKKEDLKPLFKYPLLWAIMNKKSQLWMNSSWKFHWIDTKQY